MTFSGVCLNTDLSCTKCFHNDTEVGRAPLTVKHKRQWSGSGSTSYWWPNPWWGNGVTCTWPTGGIYWITNGYQMSARSSRLQQPPNVPLYSNDGWRVGRLARYAHDWTSLMKATGKKTASKASWRKSSETLCCPIDSIETRIQTNSLMQITCKYPWTTQHKSPSPN